MDIPAAALRAFSKAYDDTQEDIAAHARGAFLDAFPLEGLPNITLNEYVIGHQTPTFCAHVEAKTRAWANIQGATADKFGIYFGRTKSDPNRRYRFTRRYGNTADEAFAAVKEALLNLVELGQQDKLDFRLIDNNPLSQMFKAKILSLYFPDRFINVCSGDDLALLGGELGYGEDLDFSDYQHRLIDDKLASPIARKWSNPKFMAFLYATYSGLTRGPASTRGAIRKPRKRSYRKVNFEDIRDQRDAIGKTAELFALEWEKQRLIGANLGSLVPKIDDRRDRPGYGYDFLSHSAPSEERYIEVKSVARLPNAEGHRFFLSQNEYVISKSAEHVEAYYFYLVLFDGNGKPCELKEQLAAELYRLSDLSPASYTVRFDVG